MECHTEREARCPQCLTLRVHCSILLLAEDANHKSGDIDITLPSGVVFGSSERNGNELIKFEGNNSHDGRVRTREENAVMSHVFVMADNESPIQSGIKMKLEQKNFGSRLDFLTSSATERIVVEPATDQVQDYGRRARARSEKQRQNRSGIKVIDASPLMIEQGKTETKKRSSSVKTDVGKKKQRRQHNNQTQLNFSTHVSRKTGQSFCTPDISQMLILPKDIQSSYIQLHGIPIGCTFENIRKFFTGLIPERILVLLSNRVYIPSLDSSSYDNLSSSNLQNLVHANNDVRVLVKFDSVSAAGLAADRSGETISSKDVSRLRFKCSDHQDGEKPHDFGEVATHLNDTFSIGVTKMSKYMASSLSRLSFDALPGVPLHDCVSDVESKLNPKVREILWASVEKAFQVTLESEIKSANFLIEAASCEDNTLDEMNLITLAEYKKHSIHYNRLLRVQEDLMTSMQHEKEHTNAVASIDPIARLTANAFMVIEDEINRIDSLLYQYRASRFLIN